MEDRGGISRQGPRQGQGADRRIPPRVPAVRRALDRRAARGVRAARRGRRLGALLQHHELRSRGADRARADEVCGERQPLSRLEAGDVVGGGKDRARRGGGGIRGFRFGSGVGEVSHRRRRGRTDKRPSPGRGRFDTDLDDHALDHSWQSRDQLLTEGRLRPIRGRRRPERQLGEAGRPFRVGGQARGRDIPSSPGDRFQEAQKHSGERSGRTGVRASA